MTDRAGRQLAVALLLLVAGGAAVRAETVDVRAPVREAVVHPQGATVTRRAELELGPGRHRVIVRGLPEKLDPASVVVAVQPTSRARLEGFDARLVPIAGPVHERERALIEEIARLERQRGLLEDRARAGRIQLALIERIGDITAERSGVEIASGTLDPATWRRAWEVVGSGALEILTLIRDSETERDAIAEQIEARRRELEQLRTGARGEYRLGLDVEVVSGGELALTVTHFEETAGFRPEYEARLDSEAARVELRQQAWLWQRSGEDWQDVRVVLSPARPRFDPLPPQLEPWLIDVVEIGPLARGPLQEGVAAAGRSAAVVPERLPFEVRHVLAEPVDLPADGSEQMVALAELKLDAALRVVAAPAIDPAAYLVADVTYMGDPLPPGRLRLMRDGTLVGETQLEATAPGGTLELGFGVDDAVEIERRFDTAFRSREGIFDKRRRVERRYVTRVLNGHERGLEIELRDRVPVPQDERILVELTPETTPPTHRDVDGRRGVLAWRYNYAPGEAREIRFGFAVSAPEGLQVDGF